MLALSPDADKRTSMTAALLIGLATLAACRAAPPDDSSLQRAAAEPRAAVVLVHGFARNPSYHADQLAALAGVRVAVLAPSMPWLLGREEVRDAALRATAAAVVQLRDRVGDGPPLTLVGFSAGGAVVTEAAARLAGDGHTPDGLVLLDPVPWSRTLAAAANLPRGLPVLALLAPPSGCNAAGRGAALVAALPGPAMLATVPGASHCDFEAPSDTLCQLACGPDDPARRAAIITALVRFALDPQAARPSH